MRVSPKSLDARQKVKECDKAVKEQAFQDAIASPELGGCVATIVDYTQMSTTTALLLANWGVASNLVVREGRGCCAGVEGSYSGPRIEDDGLTLEFVKGMLEAFKNQRVIHKRCGPLCPLRCGATHRITPPPPPHQICLPNPRPRPRHPEIAAHLGRREYR